MNLRWILFVSARHFRTRRREKGHTAAILSVLGIAAGVMTLNAVLAVMNGFQLGTIENILEVGSYHLQVETDAPQALADELQELGGVRTAVPYQDLFGLASGYFRDPAAVVIRSVPEDVLARDARFASSLSVPSGSFDLATPGSVVIGEQLARRLGLRAGDEMQVVGFDGTGAGSASTSAGLRVTGLFTSGFLEYDAGWAYVSLETAGILGIEGAGTVGVKLTDRFADRRMVAQISALAPDARIESWREFNRAIFGALRLEKTLMMLLVGLIFVVVALNIFQSLRRSVVERTEEIAVLKAIGAGPLALQTVFVFEGLLIGLLGGGIGTLGGILVSSNVNELFGFAEYLINLLSGATQWLGAVLSGVNPQSARAAFSVFSPAYFYIERIPSSLLPGEVAGIFVFALGSATLAAFAASRRVARIMPAQVLRYE